MIDFSGVEMINYEQWVVRKFTDKNLIGRRSKNHKGKYERKIWVEGRGLVSVPYRNNEK